MICHVCHIDKPEEQFNFRSIKQNKRSYQCKACHSEYHRKHYLKNKERYIDQANSVRYAAKRRNHQRMVDYLQDKACVDCGENDIRTLDFDHRDPQEKKHNIGEMIRNRAWKFILEEIAKCDIRCANCHRKRTAIQFGSYKYDPKNHS